jgi:hypothetical protein
MFVDTVPIHSLDLCRLPSRRLVRYWKTKCGSRAMPSRADIDPLDIPPDLLPGISIVDVVTDERRYAYRLVGTLGTIIRGNDLTGRSAAEGIWQNDPEDLLACYDRVVAERQPIMDPVSLLACRGRFTVEETIFLPLSDDGNVVNKILVFICCRENEAWSNVRSDAYGDLYSVIKLDPVCSDKYAPATSFKDASGVSALWTIPSFFKDVLGTVGYPVRLAIRGLDRNNWKCPAVIKKILGIVSYPLRSALHSLDGNNSLVEYLVATVATLLLALSAAYIADLGAPAILAEPVWYFSVFSAAVAFCAVAVVFWINAIDSLHADNYQRGDIGRVVSALARIFISWMGALACYFIGFVSITFGLVYAGRAAIEIANSEELSLGRIFAGLVGIVAILGLRHIGHTAPHNRR